MRRINGHVFMAWTVIVLLKHQLNGWATYSRHHICIINNLLFISHLRNKCIPVISSHSHIEYTWEMCNHIWSFHIWNLNLLKTRFILVLHGWHYQSKMIVQWASCILLNCIYIKAIKRLQKNRFAIDVKRQSKPVLAAWCSPHTNGKQQTLQWTSWSLHDHVPSHNLSKTSQLTCLGNVKLHQQLKHWSNLAILQTYVIINVQHKWVPNVQSHRGNSSVTHLSYWG